MESEFTPEVQLRILAWFCLEEQEAKYWVQFLEEKFFEFESLKWICTCIKHSYETFKYPPNSVIIRSDYKLTDQTFEEHDIILYDSFLEILELGLDESEYIKDVFVQFIRSRNLRILLYETEELKDKGDWEGLREALKTNEPILDFESDDNGELFSMSTFEELFQQNEAIVSGIPLIDDRMGGLYKKEMMLILADTNVGKSLLMTYIGGKALESGSTVLHITLEMSKARTMVRYCATLDSDMETTVGEIQSFRHPENFIRYLMELREKYEKKLYVYELPTGLGSVQDIERIVDRTEPDIVILDYLDLIKPISNKENKRFEIAELAMVSRGMAVKGNYHILSASQTNRMAHDRRIIDINMAAEDYDKMRTADDVIGLGQTRSDSQGQEVIMFVAKARNTQKGLAQRFRIDFQHMRFEFIHHELIQEIPPLIRGNNSNSNNHSY